MMADDDGDDDDDDDDFCVMFVCYALVLLQFQLLQWPNEVLLNKIKMMMILMRVIIQHFLTFAFLGVRQKSKYVTDKERKILNPNCKCQHLLQTHSNQGAVPDRW